MHGQKMSYVPDSHIAKRNTNNVALAFMRLRGALARNSTSMKSSGAAFTEHPLGYECLVAT
jgi:hypothetical protein